MEDERSTQPEDISGALNRVNLLGSATERLFSRLYTGLHRRSKIQQSEENDAQLRMQKRSQSLEDALAKREMDVQRLSGILAAIDEGIIMQDNDGRIVYMNAAAENLLGAHKNFWESELGTLFDAYREVTQVDSELAPLGEPTRIQVNNRILGAQLAAVADSKGERLGTMIVLRDVTRDALTERLTNQFILGISHELNTPMTVIKGMSELLINQPEDQPANRKFLEKLSRNVDILNRMVVEMLDLSEMGAGNFNIRSDLLRLEGIIWSVVNGMAPEVRRAQEAIFTQLRDQHRLYLMGDEERLRWALGHLVQNSVRYTEPGGEIIVSARVSDDQQHVAISVEDTGVGISDKDLPHIFERFYRGEPRSPSGRLLDPRGLGQGLYIARTVTEAHGGYLTVHSEQGKGSVFTMVLPAAASTAN